MSALATPEISQVLLVDPLKQFLDQLEDDLAAQVAQRFQYLVAAANKLLIPRNHAVSVKTSSSNEWLSVPCEKHAIRRFPFDRDRSIWSNEDLLKAINTGNRPQLYICGFWLDDVVAAAAIEAQMHALDTHLIVDLSLAYSFDCCQSCLDRIKQYGVVPVRLNTLLYEWMANTEDSEKRQTLEELWQQNKQIDHLGAAASRTGLS